MYWFRRLDPKRGEPTTGAICELKAWPSNWSAGRIPICSDRLVTAEDPSMGLLIARTQPWLPALLELLVYFPVLLLEHKVILRGFYNQPHPQKTLHLAAWKVSGDSMLQSEAAGLLVAGYKHCLPVTTGTLPFEGNWSHSLWGQTLSRFPHWLVLGRTSVPFYQTGSLNNSCTSRGIP